MAKKWGIWKSVIYEKSPFAGAFCYNLITCFDDLMVGERIRST
jgi:hypothetical protein